MSYIQELSINENNTVSYTFMINSYEYEKSSKDLEKISIIEGIIQKNVLDKIILNLKDNNIKLTDEISVIKKIINCNEKNKNSFKEIHIDQYDEFIDEKLFKQNFDHYYCDSRSLENYINEVIYSKIEDKMIIVDNTKFYIWENNNKKLTDFIDLADNTYIISNTKNLYDKNNTFSKLYTDNESSIFLLENDKADNFVKKIKNYLYNYVEEGNELFHMSAIFEWKLYDLFEGKKLIICLNEAAELSNEYYNELSDIKSIELALKFDYINRIDSSNSIEQLDLEDFDYLTDYRYNDTDASKIGYLKKIKSIFNSITDDNYTKYHNAQNEKKELIKINRNNINNTNITNSKKKIIKL